ncbi:MAG: ABC transporter permease [Eubacteriales bacterium]|nr:ABC transporter permease [Eubacteriales bacterium]
MGAVKRAVISLLFYKKKNLLLAILAGILFALLFLVLTISMAARHQVSQMKKTVGSSVVVQKKVQGSFFGSIGKFYTNEKDVLIGHPLVRDYNLVTTVGQGSWKGLRPYYIDEEEYLEYVNEIEALDTGGIYYGGIYDQSSFFGVTNSSDHALFAGGGYHLIKGRPIRKNDEDKHVILVSDVMAEMNGLDVGDRITIISSSSATALQFEEEVTVQGIFTYPANEEQEKLSARQLWQHPANYSFLPEELLTNLDRSAYPIEQIFVYLDDISQLEAYKKDMAEELGETFIEAGKQYYYDYYWDEDWYAQISAPFEGISRVTGIMAVMIAAGIYVILLLVCAWILRGKRREMGIVFAMGEKKGRIAMQILIEELVPLILAVVIGILSAMALVEPVSSRVLDQSSGAQINAQLEGQRDQVNRYESSGAFELRNDFLGEHFTVYRAPEKLYISESAGDIALYGGAGLMIMILSLVIQMQIVLKEKPSRILLSGER